MCQWFVGAGFGLGHMTTLEGNSYRFGARGQFWIIRGGAFSMQGETVGTKKSNGKTESDSR